MRLDGKRVLSFVEAEFEDLELHYPAMRLREEGADVLLAGPERGAKFLGKYGVPAVADLSFKEACNQVWDAVLVPGGWAPDKLRRDADVIGLVRAMHEARKPIGQICHAGWVLVSAKILSGVNVTSTPGIRDDMENAGAIWHDEAVVVDGHIVSSRRPPDLPAYGKALADLIARS